MFVTIFESHTARAGRKGEVFFIYHLCEISLASSDEAIVICTSMINLVYIADSNSKRSTSTKEP